MKPDKTARAMQRTASGFILHAGERSYEIKAMSRQGTQLRVTLKACRDIVQCSSTAAGLTFVKRPLNAAARLS